MSWPRVSLADISESIDYGHTASADTNAVGPKFLRITDIQDGRVDWSSVPRCICSESGASKYALQNGDIVFARTGATTGKSYLLSQIPEEAIFASYLIRVRPCQGNVDPGYLSQFFGTQDYWAQINRSSSGTAQGGVNASKLKMLSIPLPPLPEQRRIAAILDKADALRAKRRGAIAKLDQLLQSAFLEMFGDSRGSEFPTFTLDEVCTKITDGAHFTPTYVDEGVPFLRVTDLHSDEVDWARAKRIPVAEHEELCKRCKPERGDVLYSKNGTIGIPKLVTWDKTFSIFVSLALLKPDPSMLRGEYLESFLGTPLALNQAMGRSKTGTVTNLHLVEIRKLKIPLPSLDVQDAWIQIRRKFKRHLDNQIQSQRRLNSLVASIQRKEFN
jgi:type I restriction enzyme S subunit